jgi:hypothetical protein
MFSNWHRSRESRYRAAKLQKKRCEQPERKELPVSKESCAGEENEQSEFQ